MSSTIIIDLNQLQTNLRAIAAHLAANTSKHIKFCLPVKADAYGHGLIETAHCAAPYVDYFGVASCEEGLLLRNSGITTPILVFGGFSLTDISLFTTYNLEATIASFAHWQMLLEHCQNAKKSCTAHLKIDTGMGRIGVNMADATSLFNHILTSSNINLVGIYSHLSSSDEVDSTFTHQQIRLFSNFVNYAKEQKPEIICHLANSGGICYYPEAYFDMVRPGILSYGYLPDLSRYSHTPDTMSSSLPKLANMTSLANISPCFTLKSKVILSKTVPPNSAISYNREYITKTTTNIATIAIGYGDGYRRTLSNRAAVLINGKKYKVAGIICMDMLMVDLGQDQVDLDDEAVLIGKQGALQIKIDTIAKECMTNIYEILCGFLPRVKRIYTPLDTEITNY